MLPGATTGFEFCADRPVSDELPAHFAVAREIEHERVSSIPVQLQPHIKWTRSKEREFTDLATAKALKKATRGDLEKFRGLQEIRRREKNPMSPDEIVFQFKKQQWAAKLRKEIEDYVIFTQCRG